MKFTGKEILEDKELSNFLLNLNCNVLEMKWCDGSITSGYGREIQIDYVDDRLSLVEGLWSEPIKDNIELIFESPNLDLYKVFTLSEAAAIWGRDESTLRRALGKFHQFKEYRKAGRITLITREAMIRVYGEPKAK